MANPPLVQVRGARELRRTMKQAGEDLGDLKDVHQKTGNLVAEASRAQAPSVTGSLSGSIRATRTAGGISVKAGGARIPYAGPIHWGWPARNIEAQPFLSDAAQQTEPEWVAFYEEELEKIIERVEGDSP